jgi:hypothetical protein
MARKERTPLGEDTVRRAHGWLPGDDPGDPAMDCRRGCGAVYADALARMDRDCPENTVEAAMWALRSAAVYTREKDFADADPLSRWRETVLRITALRGEVERLSQQWERWSRTGRTDGRRDDTSRADRARLDRWTRTDTGPTEWTDDRLDAVRYSMTGAQPVTAVVCATHRQFRDWCRDEGEDPHSRSLRCVLEPQHVRGGQFDRVIGLGEGHPGLIDAARSRLRPDTPLRYVLPDPGMVGRLLGLPDTRPTDTPDS